MNAKDINIKTQLKISAMAKICIWLVAKIPVCAVRILIIRFLLNHLVKVKDPRSGRWQNVTGVKFGHS
jgi:hypothetical protein